MNSPTLHDDRIDSMRSTVMQAVDQDIRRRGRRARSVIGFSAASVLVIGFGAVGLNALDINSSTSGGDSSSAASDSAGTPELQGDASQLNDRSTMKSSAEPADNAAAAAADPDRKVITTGSISLTVKKPRQAADKLSTYVEGLGGRIDSRTEDGNGKNASASLQVRVPATKVTTMIERLKTYGTVENVSLQNDDVTATSKDLQARIDALDLSIVRLQKILTEANTTGQVISAESALTKRQEQLERLEYQKRSLDGQVKLSTIVIDMAQKPQVDSVEPGGFQGGLRNGWNALVSTVNNIVEVAGAALPWAAIALVLLGIGRLVTRRRRRS